MKILIVEVPEVSRNLLVLNFSMEGYRVVTAANGAEGLAKIIAEKPPLVVTDLQCRPCTAVR